MLDSAILAAMLTERPSRSHSRRRLDRRADAAELDQLERHAAGADARMRVDVGEPVNALVGAERHRRDARQRRKTGEVGVAERLLEKQQVGVARRLDVAARGGKREAAIGIGAERHVGTRAPARTASVPAISAASGFTPILSLKKWKPSLFLGARFRDVLLGRRIAEEPHRRDRLRAPRRRGDRSPARRPPARRDRSAPVSTAEWAPEFPSSACRMARHSAGRIQASRSISTGVEMIAHRRQQAAERVARHARRGRRLAPADRAVRRLDAHDEIVRVRDRDRPPSSSAS